MLENWVQEFLVFLKKLKNLSIFSFFFFYYIFSNCKGRRSTGVKEKTNLRDFSSGRIVIELWVVGGAGGGVVA